MKVLQFLILLCAIVAVYCADVLTNKDICTQPRIVGSCRAAKARFYYNIDSGECDTFIYGGCEGNGNNFLTKTECEAKCKGIEVR